MESLHTNNLAIDNQKNNMDKVSDWILSLHDMQIVGEESARPDLVRSNPRRNTHLFRNISNQDSSNMGLIPSLADRVPAS